MLEVFYNEIRTGVFGLKHIYEVICFTCCLIWIFWSICSLERKVDWLATCSSTLSTLVESIWQCKSLTLFLLTLSTITYFTMFVLIHVDKSLPTGSHISVINDLQGRFYWARKSWENNCSRGQGKSRELCSLKGIQTFYCIVLSFSHWAKTENKREEVTHPPAHFQQSHFCLSDGQIS